MSDKLNADKILDLATKAFAYIGFVYVLQEIFKLIGLIHE